MSAETPSFVAVLAGLGAGDQQAATVIYQRFVGALMRTAAARLNRALGPSADPESVVQSALLSFFTHQSQGDYELRSWGDVFGLLAKITTHKALTRNRDLARKKRDASRAVALEDWQTLAGGPRPEDEVMMADLLEKAFEGLGEPQRAVVEALLAGATIEEAARNSPFSTRTVDRILQRFRNRVRELLGSERS